MDTQYFFQITLEAFMDSLPILLKGMLGTFVVMGVIILCVTALNRIGSDEK